METAALSLSPLILRDLFSATELDRHDWQPFKAGIEIHVLYRTHAEGISAALLRYAPGARLQRHYHAGYEHILILSGSQIDDHGEHHAGTLLIHPPGTTHAIVSPRGCVVLAVWEKPVRPVPAGK